MADDDAPILECVPNFSEGRDPDVIAALAGALRSVPGCYLLHQDIGYDAHRTVFTVAGKPDAVVEAAFRSIQVAHTTIDMRQHLGAHPRIGAADVVPLVPLRGMSLAEAAALAHQLGERVGRELDVPVYYYEAAATTEVRRALSAVRLNGYEALPERLATPEGWPDAGPAESRPRFGAVAIGARPVLVAYNVNLLTTDVRVAKQIAGEIRSSGHHAYTQGRPGLLPKLRAIGWWMEAYGCAQVSMNLLDYPTTGLRAAFDAVRAAARRLGTDTAGSELIGLVPEAALLAVAPNLAPASAQLTSAIDYLGLAALAPFDPKARVLEYALKEAMKR